MRLSTRDEWQDMMVRALTMIVLPVLLAGCYKYVPARMGTVSPGTEVRLDLSSEGARRLEAATGSRQARLSGRLIRWADDVAVSMPVPTADGIVDRDLRQRVVVPADDVLGVEMRERDGARTAVFVGGAATLVGTALIAAFSGSFGGSERDRPPPTHEEGVLVPVWLRVFP